MADTAMAIDHRSEHQQQNRNLFDTVLLLAGMTLLTSSAAFLILSWPGFVVTIMLVGLLALAAPNVPPSAIMRLYRAEPMDDRNGRDLYAVLDELVARAGLQRTPSLYVIPSLTLNAFSVGTPQAATIAVTEGLLRKLSLRQLTGVLAHELSHIRNNDLRLLALADALGRTMQVLSWVGLGLAILYLPQYFTGDGRVPWLGIALLYFAPAISTLLQLSLSRTREFDADLDAAELTGDPEGLADALSAIERYRGHFWEDVIFPNSRRAPEPSLLRTHPETAERLARLRAILPSQQMPIAVGNESPRVSLVGLGPSAMRPRYRIPGLWF